MNFDYWLKINEKPDVGLTLQDDPISNYHVALYSLGQAGLVCVMLQTDCRLILLDSAHAVIDLEFLFIYFESSLINTCLTTYYTVIEIT